MSRLSGSIHTLRAGLVEAINAAGLPPCIVGMVLEQVRGQVAVLERQEEAEKEEEEQEAEDGALQSAE